jgi:DNA-directed RNA polymerase sigma subunit (sigma70/sigma32)
MVGLSHQQELVLLLRFGQGPRPATYEQVADALGVSPHAVEQIENEALRLLRQSAIDPLSKGWNGWDEA